MSRAKDKEPVNVFRAVRRFERLTGINSNAPREDHMTLQEYLERPRKDPVPDSFFKGARLIATIVYNPEKRTVTYERPDNPALKENEPQKLTNK